MRHPVKWSFSQQTSQICLSRPSGNRQAIVGDSPAPSVPWDCACWGFADLCDCVRASRCTKVFFSQAVHESRDNVRCDVVNCNFTSARQAGDCRQLFLPTVNLAEIADARPAACLLALLHEVPGREDAKRDCTGDTDNAERNHMLPCHLHNLIPNASVQRRALARTLRPVVRPPAVTNRPDT